MRELPGAVLFACDQNTVRSAMAEAMLKQLHGARIYVDSAGVRAGAPDPFAAAVLQEIGILEREFVREVIPHEDDLPLRDSQQIFTEREVVALSGSRRTESMWVRTTVFGAGEAPVATMLLNLASIKDSYANYEREHKALYG